MGPVLVAVDHRKPGLGYIFIFSPASYSSLSPHCPVRGLTHGGPPLVFAVRVNE